MESKEKAENSNDWKVVSISKKKGMNISMLLFSQWEKQSFCFASWSWREKNQQKTSSTEKFNTLADMTEREGEIHHDDTAESGKSDFEDDKIWIWREILNHSLIQLKQ